MIYNILLQLIQSKIYIVKFMMGYNVPYRS